MKFQWQPILLFLSGILIVGLLQSRVEWVQQPSQNTLPALGASTCRVVQHQMGESCIPQHPQRVIVMDQESLEILVALGLQPIATTTANRVGNKTAILQDKVGAITNLGKEGQPNLEKIVQLKPDLIIGMFILPQYYELLSDIAPTVSIDYSQTGWRETLKQAADILDRTSEADQLLTDYQKRVDTIGAKFSQTVETLDVTVMRFYTDVHLTQFLNHNSFAVSVLEEIKGLSIPPHQRQLQQVPNSDWGYVNISLEQLDWLEADALLIALDPGAEGSFQHYEKSPLWQRLKVVSQNHVYFVDSGYWVFGNILSAHAILNDVCHYLIRESCAAPPSPG
jgi:iron complex transport system substrate-binding protein